MIQTKKKVIPRSKVKRLKKSSPPRSFRFANNRSFPPVIVEEALSAFPLCKRANAINKIETINKTTFICPILSKTNSNYYIKCFPIRQLFDEILKGFLVFLLLLEKKKRSHIHSF